MHSTSERSNDRQNSDNNTAPSQRMVRRDWIFLSLCIIFLFFALRNVIVKDYNSETKEYLTKIGRQDAIDRVIPKTYQQAVNEKLERDKMIDQLAANYTALLKEVAYLRTEISQLKTDHNLSNFQTKH
jgi:hypothetical protein